MEVGLFPSGMDFVLAVWVQGFCGMIGAFVRHGNDVFWNVLDSGRKVLEFLEKRLEFFGKVNSSFEKVSSSFLKRYCHIGKSIQCFCKSKQYFFKKIKGKHQKSWSLLHELKEKVCASYGIYCVFAKGFALQNKS